MSTSNKTISLTTEEQAYVTEKAQQKGMSFSAMTGQIIRQHKSFDKDLDRRETLNSLRSCAMKLWKDHEIPQEAIISWVRDCTGGFEK